MTGTLWLPSPPAAPHDPNVFDVCGPLPSGTTVLEASAGTGKTFTIAALAVRYVAEGLADLSELLLVTFGRAATSELRDRVRERLVGTERALRAAAARTSPDPLVRLLAAVDDAELAARRHRLAQAVANFDGATIATTHGFCQQMLTWLGVAGDVDADAALVPDLADLVEQVVEDTYLRWYADSDRPALTVAQAREVARAAVGDPHARLRAEAPEDTVPGHRYGFALQVVAEVERRKRHRRILDYDDLLTLLLRALTLPDDGAKAAERIRARYRVVLVDEFQDTDAVQWEILQRAFHGHRTLVLIGDPKQAIYAFRGGDVRTYLAARSSAHQVSTLGRNWRSDEPLLRGLDRVFGEAALGDPQIIVHPVQARHQGRRMDGGAPVRLRHVTRSALGVTGTRNAPIGRVRDVVAADVAADVVRQLERSRLRGADGWRAVRPGDVAVLARRNADASTVRHALVASGVPAVISGLSSVFGSPAARAWLTLLDALEQPGHAGRTGALALSPFIGWDAARLAGAGDVERDRLAECVRGWAEILTERGVAALLEAASAEGLAERLLRTASGERAYTDLRHIGQALHLAATAEGLGVAALSHWLRRRVTEADEDYAEERSRRLETDAAAVQVVTVHASKGLEFPIVYVPFGWDRYESDRPSLLRYHDDDGTRILHLGGEGSPDYDEVRLRHHAAERGEDLRLLYVALTRACSQVVVWWAPSRNSPAGALTRLLLGRAGPGVEPAARVMPPRDDRIAARFADLADLADLADRAGGAISVERVDALPAPARWTPPAPESARLSVAVFARRLDGAWRRTSYTGLTSAAHEDQHRIASGEPEVTGVQDESEVVSGAKPGGAGAADAAEGHIGSPMADMPPGAGFGTLVHEVLERTDTSAENLRAELERRCDQAGSARFAGVRAEELALALEAVMSTPLGPLADERALRDVAPADRLAELAFELPLAGGDHPSAVAATVARIGDLLDRHLPAQDPFRPYAGRLAAASFGGTPLRGYLTGSLDAVLRLRVGPTTRYVVVDYKTNRLSPVGEPLTVWHYRPEAMVAAMMVADYPLQLLLYLVALHRFLRWRQPGYDPDTHLGGGLYLFVRGMCGPQTPRFDDAPAGVMSWRPAGSLIVELSALLAGTVPGGRPR